MPGIKSTIYDGAIVVNDNKDLDLSGIGPVFANKTLINGAVNRGVKVLTVDGTSAATNFSAGDKLVDALSNKAIGTIESIDSATQITLKNGSHIPLADDAVISKWMPFEIVAIQALEASTIDVLVPITNRWPGTVAADGGTYVPHSDYQTIPSGTTANVAGAALENDQALTAGTTLEGRWRFVGSTAADQLVCYLKAAPTQTF
tara:strand:+ start:176 stop:784 length:609 start_codon:yes stop_codon:yes gene_type:complete